MTGEEAEALVVELRGLLDERRELDRRQAEALDDHARRVEAAASAMGSAAVQMREAAGTISMAMRR